MLTTYDRYLREYKRGKPGALLTYKPCAAKGLWCHVCRRIAASMEALGVALGCSTQIPGRSQTDLRLEGKHDS